MITFIDKDVREEAVGMKLIKSPWRAIWHSLLNYKIRVPFDYIALPFSEVYAIDRCSHMYTDIRALPGNSPAIVNIMRMVCTTSM